MPLVTKRLVHRKMSSLTTPALHLIARTTAEDGHITDAPVSTPYHRAEKQHTKQSVIDDPNCMTICH